MAVITFKPKQIVKKLLGALPVRGREVLTNRYGLDTNTERMTLESIGKQYGITRERVRQIENYSFALIRKSDVYKKEKEVFNELSKALESFGGLVPESHFLEWISKDASTQNNVHFLLILGEPFKKRKESDEYHNRWFMDETLTQKIEDSLKKLYESLSDDDVIAESELISMFLEHLEGVSEKYKDEEITKRWLSLSKKISKNPLGDWGTSSSPNIRAKGMRDFAYLAIRRNGSPMHFTEVAKAIQKLFNKKAHTATCHNELIKDKRFVLVGRGLYALSEWGYAAGMVRDVVSEILKKNGPLTKDEIIKKVLKERYVKENTIIVNLQNSKYFSKDKEGKYSLVK